MNNIVVCFCFEHGNNPVLVTSDMRFLKENVFSVNGSFESSELCIGCPLFLKNKKIEVIKIEGNLDNKESNEEWMEGEKFPFNFILKISIKYI